VLAGLEPQDVQAPVPVKRYLRKHKPRITKFGNGRYEAGMIHEHKDPRGVKLMDFAEHRASVDRANKGDLIRYNTL
jgi:hypothetical protein